MSTFLVLDTDKDLFGGIKGENFKEFMRICFEEADGFSLSKTTPSYTNSVEDMLEKYLIKTIKTEKWFAYNGKEKLTQMIYKTSDEALDVILGCYQDVFFSKKKIPKKKYEQVGNRFLNPSILEDICFFKGGKMFLGTLSHEYICAAEPFSDAFEKRIMEFGKWERKEMDIYNIGLLGI